MTYKLITTRIEENQEQYIKEVSKLINLDKSSVFRKLLNKGIMLDRKEKALDLYLQGKFSIGKAAEFSGLYLGDFYEYMREKGVESNLTLEDFKDSLKNI